MPLLTRSPRIASPAPCLARSTATVWPAGTVDSNRDFAVAGEGGPGSRADHEPLGTALADIWQCTRCGHMQLHPLPDASVLARAYAEAASMITWRRSQDNARRLGVARLDRASCSAGGSLADLGCWVGFLVAEADARGWRAVGVEPSEFASAYARDRLGLEVITADIMTAELPRASFDAIAMGDVIEHLIDPAAVLARVRRWLTRDGVLWLALPDAGSRVARVLGRRWWSLISTHVQYFTRQSISHLLRREGFEVLEITTAAKAFSVRYYLGRLNGYSPTVGRALTGAATAVRSSTGCGRQISGIAWRSSLARPLRTLQRRVNAGPSCRGSRKRRCRCRAGGSPSRPGRSSSIDPAGRAAEASSTRCPRAR